MGLEIGLVVVRPGMGSQRRRTLHDRPVRGCQVVEERRVGGVQVDDHGVGRRRLDRGHSGDHVGRPAVDRRTSGEGRCHRGRGERGAVVEEHALAELEGVGGSIVGHGPAGGERRDDDPAGRARLVLDQSLVEVAGQQQALTGVVDVGVRRLAGVLQEAELEGVAGRHARRRGRGSARTAGRQQHGDEGHHCDRESVAADHRPGGTRAGRHRGRLDDSGHVHQATSTNGSGDDSDTVSDTGSLDDWDGGADVDPASVVPIAAKPATTSSAQRLAPDCRYSMASSAAR